MTAPHVHHDLRAQTWFAQVGAQPVGAQPDVAALVRSQADFIRQFMGQLFTDIDNGSLSAVSAHFHRLGTEVRFRLIASGSMANLAVEVDRRLNAARDSGLITTFRSEAEGAWGLPDPNYGTEIAHVAAAFTQFLESISRATVAMFAATNDARVAEHILWNWLHLVHNPMTGLERHLVEVAPQASVHVL